MHEKNLRIRASWVLLQNISAFNDQLGISFKIQILLSNSNLRFLSDQCSADILVIFVHYLMFQGKIQ